MDTEGLPTTSGLVKVGLDELYLTTKHQSTVSESEASVFQIPNLHKAENVVRYTLAGSII